MCVDVLFEVDDGQVAAHKVLLMAGCEMMNAMFSNSFLESSADVVSMAHSSCMCVDDLRCDMR